jgi:AraC-like DNA-binding protein
MTSNDGIAPDGTRYLMRGVSYLQMVNVAAEGVTMKEAAQRLKVSEYHFGRTMRRLSLTHWFPRTQHGKARKVTLGEAVKLAAEGHSLKGAAKVAGLSYSRFQHLAKEYGLHNSFHPN